MSSEKISTTTDAPEASEIKKVAPQTAGTQNSVSFGSSGISRRSVLSTGGALTLSSLFGSLSVGSEALADGVRSNRADRRTRGMRLRDRDSRRGFRRRGVTHPRNNDEKGDTRFWASFSKALPHDEVGEVTSAIYNRLLDAVTLGRFDRLESVNVGIARLANPEAAFAFALQGADSHQLMIPRAPGIRSEQTASEMGELYWKALCRDVPFTDFYHSALVKAAISEISTRFEAYGGPGSMGNEILNPYNVFRGTLAGDERGPYVSQFLMRDFFAGAIPIKAQVRTPFAGFNNLATFDDWLLIQNGQLFKQETPYDPQPRYIRNGRDLAEYVHEDPGQLAYFNAAQILLDSDLPPFTPGNPLFDQSYSAPFVTFGREHIFGVMQEAIRLAHQAAWFQKWCVHRRARPEEYGGRVDNTLVGRRAYPLPATILESEVLQRTFDTQGSFFLSQAFQEGCPTHPAYPAGHATVAGACVTVLKAFFDEDFPISDPVVASADGLNTVPYTGPGAGSLTVGSELNKLASNISLGRNWAGVHYRTDATSGIELGERVAIRLLRAQMPTYRERAELRLTTFSGETISIS